MSESPTPRLDRLTPVLIVDRVEPCVGFWTEKFGFALIHEVRAPDGALVFASLGKDAIEVMYQTRASVLDERPEAAAEIDGRSVVLFVQVADLDAVERAVADAPPVRARHRTFYGSSEIYVREPGGHVVGFAQFG